MNIADQEIRLRLRLGEDSGWEFKQVDFSGDRPTSPRREDLADEMAAFANANGGVLLCGVSDIGRIQGMSAEQMAALDRMLVETSTDALEPFLRIHVHKRELDGLAFVLVEVPKGNSVHERAGRAFIRVGSSKRQLGGDERLRLAQRRAQSRYTWFDQQIVPDTGFHTLKEHLWEPLISAAGADDPRRALTNMRLLATDEADVHRATVAGVLLCTDSPHEWLPQATITATHYRGKDRASGQLDAQEIEGPLPAQIAAAVKFVIGNMRVSARKTPAREDVPQYSKTAVFEAVVNAAVHRDYSTSARRIRVSMFKDRLEIDSPGQLFNGLTIDGMDSSQATRNEALASVFGRIPVGDISGSRNRRYMMVYAAAPGYAAGLEREWTPSQGGLLLEVTPLAGGGAVVIPNEFGHLPGLRGRLNPKRDTLDRTYLYADNVAIDEGRQQPVPFRMGKPLRLTDAFGVEMSVTIVDIIGRSSLVEYQPFRVR